MFTRVGSDEMAHVFFTSEGYDDFRKVRNDEIETEINVPGAFTFVSGMPKDEYNAKLSEWRVFRSLPNDTDLEKVIRDLTGE